ncbi:MAG: malto-oligosyltrehalose trehalohydrolase [Dehalococcoidia bacterium]
MPDRPASGWRLTMGADLTPDGVEFRVWAPHATSIDVELGNVFVALARDDDGIWSGVIPDLPPGTTYRLRVDGRWGYPDPYSRSQPEGPHGPSQVIDPGAFVWHDGAWPGLRRNGLVLYELHVGAYTPEGTFDALADQLDVLAALGVTAIELMPVAEFPGRRNWGYDGVDLFAPASAYGGPEAFKRLVDAAHARGLGVVLDVVYNHFGPDGNYLLQFAPEYLSDTHKVEWGDAVNFDGPNSARVRQFVIDNACYWFNEYHVDGLRLDATFSIKDDSPRHILEEIATTARASVPSARNVIVMAETYENDERYLRPADRGGFGYDAVWADDFHHVIHTFVSREQSGYYADYAGTTDELARTINQGWLFRGEYSSHLEKERGTPADAADAASFVYFLQNHDQVGNRAFGRRLSHLVGSADLKPLAVLLLLLPYTPMIFMGQEFAASSRFYYFTDHNPELGQLITEGRRREVARYLELSGEEHLREIPDPQDPQTFLDTKLNLAERDENLGEHIFALYRELIALRRSDAVLRHQDRFRMKAVAAGDTVLLVHLWAGAEHRLIAANFGVAFDTPPAAAGVPKDLLRYDWEPMLSTDERRFGGTDDRVRFDRTLVSLPPRTAAWLTARRRPLPARLTATLRRLLRR